MNKHWIVAIASAFWLGCAAAQTWPTKPITLIAGTPPGGAIDVYARAVAEHMAGTLGQPVLVEYKPGANGNISAEFVQRAPADGYTVWIGTQSMTEISPSAYEELRWKFDDFTGVIKGVEAPLVLVAHPSVAARNLKDLGPWLKANPGKASYASFSPGTPSHFLGYQLSERLGVPMTHIPYKGSGPQMQDMVGGHVLLGFTQVQSALPHLKDGRLIALATTGTTRWRQLPEVPTLAELGFEDLSATIWFGLFVRRDIPEAVYRRIVEAAQKAHADATVKGRLEAAGFDVSGQIEPGFSNGIRAGQQRWARIVKATGFKASN